MAAPSRHGAGGTAGDAGRYCALVADARGRLMRRDLEGAKSCLAAALGADGRRPEAFNLLGVVEELRGEHGEARTCWRLALALAPEYAPALENLRLVSLHPRPEGGLSLG